MVAKLSSRIFSVLSLKCADIRWLSGNLPLLVRIGFNADSDAAFNHNADPVSDPLSQTNSDPVPGQTFT
jgi:hypothetical protein